MEPDPAPYLHLRRRDGRLRADGARDCVIGGPPEGHFAEWRFDGDVLTARNDRYGLQPLFCWATRDEIALSPSLLRLLRCGAPTELDAAALAVFLRLGNFLAEDTPFTAIKALPPGAELRFGADGLNVKGGFVRVPERSVAVDEAIDAYAELFPAALRRMAPASDIVLPLSGGKDSRHILLGLDQIGWRPRATVTVRHYPPRPDENEAAAALAHAVGVAHTSLEQPRSRLRAELRGCSASELQTYEHGWYVRMGDHLEGQEATVYDGLAGDVLSESSNLDEQRLGLFERGDLPALAELLLKEAYLPDLLQADAARRFSRQLALERLVRELARHTEAPNPVGSFYFWNRMRRGIALAPLAIVGRVATVHTPFLDHELHDFLASLPARTLMGSALHTKAIARAYPGAGELPYARGGAAHDTGHYRRFAAELGRSAVFGGGRSLVRPSFLGPRVARCLVDRAYSPAIVQFGPLAVYLARLESAVSTGAPRRRRELRGLTIPRRS